MHPKIISMELRKRHCLWLGIRPWPTAKVARDRRTHTQADTQNGCCCGTKSVMAHEKLPGHAQDFIIMCLGRKTMAALAAAAAAPHAGATAIPKNESRIVRLNVSGGFHFSRAEQSTEQSTEHGSAGVAATPAVA